MNRKGSVISNRPTRDSERFMKNSYLVGAIAGGVTIMLYLSLATGSAMGMILFCLAPLPGLVAGFGWGVSAAIVAGGVGALLALLVAGPAFVLSFVMTLAIPAIILTHYLFLFRVHPPFFEGEATGKTQGDENRNDGQAADEALIEWYPIGNVVLITALYGGSLALLSVLMMGPGHEAYVAKTSEMVDFLFTMLKKAGLLKKQLPAEEMQRFKLLMQSILPASIAMTWTLLMLVNAWLAGHVTRMSGQLRRPWPNLARLQYPRRFSLVMLGLLLTPFLVEGTPALIVSGYAGALYAAFLLLGLAVAHDLTRLWPLRNIFLFGVYMSVIVIGWGGLVMAAVGVLEPYLNLRKLNMFPRQEPEKSDNPEKPD